MRNAAGLTSPPKSSIAAYFLAPGIRYSSIGPLQKDTDSDINDDGVNVLTFDNIFETELKTLKLNLHYRSEDSRDRFNKIFGLWRSSYTSYMDFRVDYNGAHIKSSLYDSPKNACEQGFLDVRDHLYRGLLSSADTYYDQARDLCIILQNGQELGSFHVWHKDDGIVGDFHYLSQPSGETLVFSRAPNGNAYVADDHGIQVSMGVLADGRYQYIDSKGFVRTYSSDGTLTSIMFEGQKTTLTYDANYKLIRVDGPLGQSLLYQYAADESLSSITFSGKQARFSYDDQYRLTSIDMATDEIFLNETAAEQAINNDTLIEDTALIAEMEANQENLNIYNIARFTYNASGLLVTVERQGVKDIIDPSIHIDSNVVAYSYDAMNRIAQVRDGSGGDGFNMDYQPTQVTRLFNNGNSIVHQIAFFASKQQISVMTDSTKTLNSRYTPQGQLSQIDLVQQSSLGGAGNIVAQAVGSGVETLNMRFSYNARGLVNKIQSDSNVHGKKFVQLAYKSRYPKPTKVLTNENVTFFDFNPDGQLIKKTSLTFDKAMRLRAASVTLDEVQKSSQRVEKSYHYNKSGFLTEVQNIVTGKRTLFEVTGNGKLNKKAKIKTQLLFPFDKVLSIPYSKWLINRKRSGWTPQTGAIDVRRPDTQTVFVGGFMDLKKKAVFNYAKSIRQADTNNNYNNYYTWNQINTYFGKRRSSDPFVKSRQNLVVVAHSWGGDSAVEASKQTGPGSQVDLLITVDPVGAGDYNDGARHWIELYAQSGRPFHGYLSWKRGYKTISFHFWKCKRHGWRLKCGWHRYSIRVPYWYIAWTKTMAWDFGDWVAYFGGKGWYSSYDPGDAYPDQLIKIPAHHGDFGYMLWAMENGAARRPNNQFNISNKARFIFSNQSMINKQNKYAKYQANYGIGLWR